MSNGVDDQIDVPTAAESEQVQTEQATSMVTDEELATNGAPVRTFFWGAFLSSLDRVKYPLDGVIIHEFLPSCVDLRDALKQHGAHVSLQHNERQDTNCR